MDSSLPRTAALALAVACAGALPCAAAGAGTAAVDSPADTPNPLADRPAPAAPSPTQPATAPLERFRTAERALSAGDHAAFESLAAGLAEYPLYPYLRFAALIRDLPATPDAEIEAFLAAYPDTPLAERLRPAFLERLGEAGRFADYVRVYREDDSIERRCLYARALLATGRRDAALSADVLTPLWLSAESRPKACDPLFDAWRAAGGLTPELAWARIRLAMEAGRTGLAGWLKRDLPESERPWLDRWLALRGDPARLAGEDAPGGHPMAAPMVADALVRLAAKSPEQAGDALERHARQLADDPAAADRAHRAVARALVRLPDPAAQARGLALWDGLSATPDNLDAQEERLRAAIRLGDWKRARAWIRRMPESMEKADRWLYWLGRAETALGHRGAARKAFERAAAERSLWGFLAADRLGLPYRLDHAPTPAEPAAIAALARTGAFARIRELRKLGREADMRREWRTLTRDLDDAGLMAAAYAADVLAWHDQAIFTLARTGYWDDLQLRFPLKYREAVAEQAWQTGLPEEWIYAVIRQESVFAPAVASGAGALGLMQLMPATARQVAADPDLALGIGAGGLGRREILDPATNIALGSAYLARMRDRFGHPALATAAYNAGPHRVERWRPARCTEADLWLLAIPFLETRGYVERVLAYRAIYAARLGQGQVRVSEWLRDVPGRDSLAVEAVLSEAGQGRSE